MNRRPLRVTLSIILVLLLTVWNGLRMLTALQWRDVLVEFGTRQPPILTAIVGAVWFAVGLVLLWGLLWRKAWAGSLLLWAAAGYSVWYWVERFAWQEARPNWLFAVILNLILFLFVLFTTRPMMREAYEQKYENRTFESNEGEIPDGGRRGPD